MLIHQSKANLDVKILFGNIPHRLYSDIRQFWQAVCLGMGIPFSILVYDFLGISETDNADFNAT